MMLKGKKKFAQELKEELHKRFGLKGKERLSAKLIREKFPEYKNIKTVEEFEAKEYAKYEYSHRTVEEKRPYKVTQSALSETLLDFNFELSHREKDMSLPEVIERLSERFAQILDEYKQKLGNIKAFVRVEFNNFPGDSCAMATQAVIVNDGEEGVLSLMNHVEGDIVTKILNNEEHYNGFFTHPYNISSVQLKIAKYTPFKGSSYIELPTWIKTKKACINPKNEDDKCFMWAVLASLHPAAKDGDRITKYTKFVDQYDWSMLTFPVSLDNIKSFEDANGIAVNVFGYDGPDAMFKHVDNKIINLRRSTKISEKIVDLILIDQRDDVTYKPDFGKMVRKVETEGKTHYVCVRDLSRLLSSQNSKAGHALHFCRCCMHGFTKPELLEKHQPYCNQTGASQRVEMPKAGSTTKFKSIHKQLATPYVIYADSEAFQSDEGLKTSGKTVQLTKHVGASFHYKIVCAEGWKLPEGVQEFSPIFETAADFMESIISVTEELSESVKSVAWKKENFEPINMKYEDHLVHRKATNCYMCGLLFDREDKKKWKKADHCHVTGKYRGAACNRCNLNLNYKDKSTPVFFHNARGYDWHLLMESLNYEKCGEMSVIPRNFEQYVSWSVGNARFLDSLGFFAPGSSIEVLVKALVDGNGGDYRKALPTVARLYGSYGDEALALICRKGTFPYDWFTGPECYNATELPPIECFYSKLSGQSISKDEYEHAKKVWAAFGCKTFRDYHDIYLRCDVAQLADCFEAYRTVAQKGYGLDPCWYFSAANMAWDSMLKKTGIELENIWDPDMFTFFEKGKRGGISMISHRYAKANNQYLPDYDKTKDSSYILYLDANNLYGWAMSEKLPYKGFKWLTQSQIDSLNIMSLDSQGDNGYTLEVDLEYPKEIHDLHNDYPLAPEKMSVSPEMVSPFNQEIAANIKVTEGCVKLIPNLQNKEAYVVHLSTLQFYMKHGLKVTKIHRVVTYKQKAWLREYIDYNTTQRAKCSANHEKDFWKLMNNSVYGKTMENVRERKNIKIRNNVDKAVKDLSSPYFESYKIFNKDLAAIQLKKHTVVLNKPVYVGAAVLDLSKELMYRYWYEHLKPMYGDKVKLLATDTDSLMFHVQTEDAYKDMKANADQYDLSEYKEEDANLGWMHDKTNLKVIGKFKDETGVKPISAFVGLKPKMYAIKQGSGDEKKTLKGISKSVVKYKINFEDYREVVECKKFERYHKQAQIRSTNHTINTIEVEKRSLCAYDTKRWILADGVTTYAHGHNKISAY